MNRELKKHVLSLLAKGVRLDGRKPLDYREVKIEYDVSKSAEGSAKVQIGDTVVITGVKMETFAPYADDPDKGSLMVGAELSPMASEDYETGPPSIEAIEVGRVVDRGIRESHALDFEKMCVKSGELAWMAVVDICPINISGNLFDAASISAIAALKSAKLPALKEDQVDYDTKTEESVPLTDTPLAVTVHKIGDHFIVDPLEEEEKVSDARLTVATIEDGTLCALQKGGESPLSVEDIDKMVEIAMDVAGKLRKAL